MSIEHIDAGALDQRIEVLKLIEVESTYSWEVERRSWAKAELSTGRNNFFVHGIGATGVTLTIRRQPLTLGNAIRWMGQHCFITSIQPLGRNHLVVEAALVRQVLCQAEGEMVPGLGELNRPRLTPGGKLSFPAAVTEKYLRREEEGVNASTETALILSAPKAVPVLPSGRLVAIDGPAAGKYEIQTTHLLDDWHNEYEIVRGADA